MCEKRVYKYSILYHDCVLRESINVTHFISYFLRTYRRYVDFFRYLNVYPFSMNTSREEVLKRFEAILIFFSFIQSKIRTL